MLLNKPPWMPGTKTPTRKWLTEVAQLCRFVEPQVRLRPSMATPQSFHLALANFLSYPPHQLFQIVLSHEASSPPFLLPLHIPPTSRSKWGHGRNIANSLLPFYELFPKERREYQCHRHSEIIRLIGRRKKTTCHGEDRSCWTLGLVLVEKEMTSLLIPMRVKVGSKAEDELQIADAERALHILVNVTFTLNL